MIDLRSDTLTLPDKAMLATILDAPLGDDGRLDETGRGEDPTVNRLEEMAAELTGKEAALLCPSGTMGNQTAVLTYCRPGDVVLVDELQHLDVAEHTAFEPRLGQLRKLTYKSDADGMPDLADLERQLRTPGVRLICTENTHNYAGGACVTPARLAAVRALADRCSLPVHMDGARVFNAAEYLEVEVKEIARHVDSLMFCVSKGLGAPVGSLLCGSAGFVKAAKATRKLLGGAMRQAGIIAAPAIYALTHNIERLREDNENARHCAQLLREARLGKIGVQANVQTNIVMLETNRSGLSPAEFCARAKSLGILISPSAGTFARLVFYKGISRADAEAAAAIIIELDGSL